MRSALICFAPMVLALGCSTIRSQPLDRLEDDTLVENPDSPLRGVPVTLKVPTHLELTVEEVTFWEVTSTGGIRPLHTCRPTRSLSHNLKYTEKVFVVDPVKPLSGTGKYGFSFRTQQQTDEKPDAFTGYGRLKGINYEAVDTTITDSAALVATVLGMVGPNGILTANGTQPTDPKVQNAIQTTRVLAFTRLDINSPSFEADVGCFVQTHLNERTCGHECPAKASESN